MKTLPTKIIQLILLSFVLIFQFSCNKDSDLLADHILLDDTDGIGVKLVADDRYLISHNNSVVLEVLENDSFTEEDNVTITETSTPENGTVVVNEDNTVTYTPSPSTTIEETVTDTFTYTTESTSNGTSTPTGQGTVTVELAHNRTPVTGDNVYFVTTTGKSTNNGSSETTAWSLKQAFAAAKAGDIVYIKAGNYGNLKIKTSRSGVAGKPIKFIGYTTAPGDINAANGPTYTYANWVSNGRDLPDNIMPHLELNPVNKDPDTEDRAFSIDHEYVELHNFMVSEYENGFDITASNVTLNNCIGNQFGNWDSKQPNWNEFGYAEGDLSTGYAVVVRDSYSVIIENCLMIDAGMVSYFFVKGGNHIVRNNWGVAENPGNGTDYIFDFYGADNCKITNNTAKKTYFNNSIGHPGRCLIFQAQADNNTVDGLTSIGLKLQIENSDSNSLSNIKMTSSGGSGDQMGCFQIYGQSDDNIIKNLSIDGGGGIQFLGYAAGTGENPELPHTSAGNNNYFINVTLSNLDSSAGNALVSFHRLGIDGKTGGTNYIIGLTANNFGWIINANRPGTITFEDSNFSNGRATSMDTFFSGWGDATGSYKANFINCTFNSNKFSTPSGN